MILHDFGAVVRFCARRAGGGRMIERESSIFGRPQPEIRKFPAGAPCAAARTLNNTPPDRRAGSALQKMMIMI